MKCLPHSAAAEAMKSGMVDEPGAQRGRQGYGEGVCYLPVIGVREFQTGKFLKVKVQVCAIFCAFR